MMMDTSPSSGAVTGVPRWLLRIEGLLVLCAATLAYSYESSHTWTEFVILFFVPDVSMLAYLGGKKLGALVYNTFHSYGLPILGGFLLWYMPWTDLTYILLIWMAHIGFDRALGYGLKYREGFNYTHLGRIGKRPPAKNT